MRKYKKKLVKSLQESIKERPICIKVHFVTCKEFMESAFGPNPPTMLCGSITYDLSNNADYAE